MFCRGRFDGRQGREITQPLQNLYVFHIQHTQARSVSANFSQAFPELSMITDVGSMFDIDRCIVLDQTRFYSLTQIFRQIAKFTAGRIAFCKVWSYNIICLIWTVHLMLGQTTLSTQILRQIAKFPAGRIAFERVWSHNIIWIKALCVCSTNCIYAN